MRETRHGRNDAASLESAFAGPGWRLPGFTRPPFVLNGAATLGMQVISRMSVPALASSLSRRHDLWWQFTVRAVEMRHRGSYLGFIWTVLNPLLMLALYVVVFGYIFGSKFHARPNETPVDYSLAVFMGLILFHVTSETIGAAPTYIVSSPNLVKKVVFPLDILPLANVTALWFHFSVSFCLLILAMLVTGRPPSLAGVAWMPLILLPHLLLTVGVGWIMAALGVFFRDITQVVNFFTQVLLYASAVFYPVSWIPQRSQLVWDILKWNPFLQTVELSRRTLLWDMRVPLDRLAYTWAAGLAVLFLGRWLFKKLQPAFADVI